jgi:23S rRNA pseudouridine1911/1915/1917 synthase
MNPIPTILLDTSDYLVINKPSGLVVHLDGKKDEYSLVDWILEHYPEITGVGEPLQLEYKGEEKIINRPGIVHRLDRETSGVMIIAKNQVMYEHVKKQFQDHTIQKQYIAFVQGWTDDRGIIGEPIGRNGNDIRKWATGRHARGTKRDAVTRYVTQKKFLDSEQNKFSLVHLFPETGRTHQLRVHMKSIQHAIIGDGLYAPQTVGNLGFNRVALHAEKITFQDLQNNEQVVIAPPSDDFSKILDKLGD